MGGGFGSSSTGFGSSSTNSMGASALSRLELAGKSKGSSLSGFGNNDAYPSSRYDDDMDAGHQALSMDDADEESEVSRILTWALSLQPEDSCFKLYLYFFLEQRSKALKGRVSHRHFCPDWSSCISSSALT